MKKKHLSLVALVIICVLCFASCGNGSADSEPVEDEGCDVAMIAQSPEMESGFMDDAVWHDVKTVSDDYELKAKLYEPEDAGKEYYMESIEQALDDGAGLIIMSGSKFETTVYKAQSDYPDTDFVILDGVPHNKDDKYKTGSNTVSIVFAEEEAGYMAGYAAVKDGYKALGFMGGKKQPGTKRYGYGFIQGAAAAAKETKTKVEMQYKYNDTEKESKDVTELAEEWYKDGTEVIFACGSEMNRSVITAAEKCDGKVIGNDVDQSSLSETVITSAEKGIESAVREEIKSYAGDRFTGGTAFNYAAKDNGVALEMDNAKLQDFSVDDYDKMYDKLQDGKIELKKDDSVNSLKELGGKWVTIVK